MTPTSGTVGAPVTISIGGPYSLGGDYKIFWSSVATFDEDKTIVLARAHVPEGTSSAVASFTVPEAVSGIYYVRFGHTITDQSFSFPFIVGQGLKVVPSSVKVGDTVNVTGTGFTEDATVILMIDRTALGSLVHANKVGSFTSSLVIPAEIPPGEHQLSTYATRGGTKTALIEILPKDNPAIAEQNNVVSHVTKPSNNDVTQPVLALNPPRPPIAVSPIGHNFGLIGSKSVTFKWVGDSDSRDVTYTLEVANDVNFSAIKPGMQRTGLTETSCTIEVPPGTYYWRVKAVDGAGNESYWAYAPYAFKVAEFSCFIGDLLHLIHLS